MRSHTVYRTRLEVRQQLFGMVLTRPFLGLGLPLFPEWLAIVFLRTVLSSKVIFNLVSTNRRLLTPLLEFLFVESKERYPMKARISLDALGAIE